jgi:hypothetical protein
MSSDLSSAADVSTPGAERVLVLEAGRAERHYWRGIWFYRELFVILALRAECGLREEVRFMVAVGRDQPSIYR